MSAPRGRRSPCWILRFIQNDIRGGARDQALLACRNNERPPALALQLHAMTSPASPPPCPACTLEDVLGHSDHWECATCGHEWPKEIPPETARVVKDAHGNALVDGDTVVLIKDLK